ncbi:large-conductance mechanosensitive channel protein MscL [Chloroflexota bacterium]
MLKEFRVFLQQGNVIDLAMAVIIGGAFGAIVNSLVDDIFMPVIGILIGGIDFSGLSIQVGEAVILYGNFIHAIINFVIIAFAMFLVIRSYNQLRSEEQSAPPKPSAEEKILIEIRDLLKERNL